MNSVIWYGRSGTAYSFVALPLDGPFDDQSGIYVFARQDATGDGWNAICIGEADSFSLELPDTSETAMRTELCGHAPACFIAR